MQIVNKTISLQLVGLNGNAFNLMGAFANQARKEKWSKSEIDTVLNEAMSKDYDHLLQVLVAHCVSPDEDE